MMEILKATIHTQSAGRQSISRFLLLVLMVVLLIVYHQTVLFFALGQASVPFPFDHFYKEKKMIKAFIS